MRLRVEGNQLVNTAGEVVHLRGANLHRFIWRWPRTGGLLPDLDYLEQAVAWGANCFTLWVHSEPINSRNTQYQHYLTAMVSAARERGVYVILSWHADSPRDEHPRLISKGGNLAMASLARRFRDHPNVLYAAHAEPGHDGLGDDSLATWPRLKQAQSETISTIRSQQYDAVIGVAGTNWSQDVTGMLEDPIEAPGIFVKPHVYGPMPETAQRAGVLDASEHWPVVIGEFADGERMTADDARQVVQMAESTLSGWQAWNLSDLGGPTMFTSEGANSPSAADALTPWGQAVREHLKRLRPEEPEDKNLDGFLGDLRERTVGELLDGFKRVIRREVDPDA